MFRYKITLIYLPVSFRVYGFQGITWSPRETVCGMLHLISKNFLMSLHRSLYPVVRDGNINIRLSLNFERVSCHGEIPVMCKLHSTSLIGFYDSNSHIFLLRFLRLQCRLIASSYMLCVIMKQ